MLNELGYNVFAIDLFGKGIRPTEGEKTKTTHRWVVQRWENASANFRWLMEAKRLGET